MYGSAIRLPHRLISGYRVALNRHQEHEQNRDNRYDH
jgi:hypothetical protein